MIFHSPRACSDTSFCAGYGPRALKVFVKQIDPARLDLLEEEIKSCEDKSVAVQVYRRIQQFPPHTGLLRLYDVVQDSGRHYIVAE